MTEVTFTFRLDPELKAAFTAMAGERDMTAAQALRRMMREAVDEHGETAAHERWQRREIDDAIHEADAISGLNLSNDAIELEWQRRKDEIGRGLA